MFILSTLLKAISVPTISDFSKVPMNFFGSIKCIAVQFLAYLNAFSVLTYVVLTVTIFYAR